MLAYVNPHAIAVTQSPAARAGWIHVGCIVVLCVLVAARVLAMVRGSGPHAVRV